MSAEALAGVGWTGRVMQILHVATALIAVNVMFLLGTLLGLGVLGLMPASVAASAVLRRGDLLTGTAEGGVVRTFWARYRAEFGRANLAGIPFGLAAALLAADAVVLPQLQGPVSAALLVFTAVVAAATLVSAITTIVLLSRYDDRPAAVLRFALLLPITAVPMTLGVLVVIVAWTAIVGVLPVLLPLVGVAIPLAIAVRLIDRRLDRIADAG
jgi:uncharacterized membrane protein YesL